MAAMKNRTPNRQQGMTLLELMMAISVLGILTALAVPSFRDYTSNARVTSSINGVVSALALARSEALRRSAVTRVCASVDLATCSASTNWVSGWLVFVDNDNDGAVSANELIQSWPALAGGMIATGTVDRVSYNTMGMVTAATTFNFVPPNCTGNRQGQTIVSVSGNVQSSKIACP